MTLSRYAVTPTGSVFIAKSQDGRTENGGRPPEGCQIEFGLARDFLARVNNPDYNPFAMAALHACPVTETVDAVLSKLEKERARGRANYHKAKLAAIADDLNQAATKSELDRKQALKRAKQDRRNVVRREASSAKQKTKKSPVSAGL